jgi:hypothetical protein
MTLWMLQRPTAGSLGDHIGRTWGKFRKVVLSALWVDESLQFPHLSVTPAVMAQEINTGIFFPSALSQDAHLKLTGVGVRRKLVFHVYAFGLYLHNKDTYNLLKSQWGQASTDQLLNDGKFWDAIMSDYQDKALVLVMYRKISGDLLTEAFNVSLMERIKQIGLTEADSKAETGNKSPKQKDEVEPLVALENFKKFFADRNLSRNTKLTFQWQKGTSIEASKQRKKVLLHGNWIPTDDQRCPNSPFITNDNFVVNSQEERWFAVLTESRSERLVRVLCLSSQWSLSAHNQLRYIKNLMSDHFKYLTFGCAIYIALYSLTNLVLCIIRYLPWKPPYRPQSQDSDLQQHSQVTEPATQGGEGHY